MTMTNKQDLQQELLEKVKPGMKPSDIKQQAKNSPKPSKKPISPPPIEIDEGYVSEEEKIPTPPPLPNNQNLHEKIKALHRQIQVYQDFKEADLRIKEKLKQELAQQEEIIAKYPQAETEAEKVLNQQKK